MKSIFLCEFEHNINWVYAKIVDSLKQNAGLCDKIYRLSDIKAAPENFVDVEYIFSTWGMPGMSEEEICTLFPSLKCVFYAAGSVQGFARPFLSRGVRVFSAWAANAVPVAEYTVAQIVLANKGFFATSALMSVGDHRAANDIKGKYPGSYGEKIGIIGAGMIGKLVINMLKAYKLDVLVFDPFLSDDKAAELGVKKCSLEELFATCQVISNHLADNPQTRRMLTKAHFVSMRPYATFINTGRGAQVVEDDLCDALSERGDLTAILDVTNPEPPQPDSRFYTLPNCLLTPHIAGSNGDEVCRMAAYMAEEFERYIKGDDCRYEVDEQMLKTMA